MAARDIKPMDFPARKEVTDDQRRAAEERWPDIEAAFKQNLGMTMEWDEAVDGCTVYEPDGYCPHGYVGLAQIRVGLA